MGNHWILLFYILNIALISNYVVSQSVGCQPVKLQCTKFGFTKTTYRNWFKEKDAMLDMARRYRGLLKSTCSMYLPQLLCSIYTPLCVDSKVHDIGPCRSLCLEVRQSCLHWYLQQGSRWPDNLDCERFPPKSTIRKHCVDLPKNIRITSNNETTAEKRLQQCLGLGLVCSMSLSTGMVIRELNCEAECYPDCKYQWLKNGVLIRHGYTLPLGPFDSKMSGNYTCKATNIIGQSNHTLTLYSDASVAQRTNIVVFSTVLLVFISLD